MLGGGGGEGCKTIPVFSRGTTFILAVGTHFSGHCRCGEVACWVERRVNIWSVRRDEKKVAVVE